MTVIDKVIVSFFVLNQLICFLTNTICIEIIVINASVKSCNTIFSAVIIINHISRSFIIYCKPINYSGLHITRAVKEISFAIDFKRFAGIYIRSLVFVEIRTIPITGTFFSFFPNAFGYTAFFKYIFDMAVCNSFSVKAGISGLVEIVPIITMLNPAVYKATRSIVIYFSVYFSKSRFGKSLAAITNKFVFNNFIAVTACFGFLTPINYGIANFAVSSAGVTGFGAGSCFIFKSNGGMYVCSTSFCFECRITESSLKFSIYAEFFVGECAENTRFISVNIGNFTHINVYFKVIRPEAISIPICFCCISFNLDVGIKIDYTNRKGCKGCFAGLAVVSSTGDSNGCSIIFFINGVLCSKSCCKVHMIKFPMVAIVKVDNGFNRFDSFDIGCIYVHPIYGTAVKAVKRGICGNDFNSGSINRGINIDKSDNNGFVAHVISNFKFNAMYAVCNCSIGNGHSSVCKSYINFNTVDICFCRRSIKTGCVGFGSIFCNFCRNSNKIAFSGCSYIFFKSDGEIISCKFNTTENGSFSVVNRIGEVCGNVVNINSLETVDSSVSLPKIVGVSVREHKFDETEVVRIVFACVISDKVLAVDARNKDFGISAYINREIFPARFIHCIINLRLINNGYGVLFIIGSVTIGIIPIKNTDPAVFIFIRDICPETDGFCVFYNNTFIKEEVALRITAIGNIGSRNGVHFNSHGAFAVMYFAISGGCIAEFLMEAFVIAVNVCNIPLFDICSFFKIKEYFRTFTEAESCLCNKIGSCESCGYGTGKICRCFLFRNGSEGKAFKSTESFIGGSESYAFGVNNNVMESAIDGCNKTDSYFFIKRNSHDFLCKFKGFGFYDFNRIFTNNITVINELCGCSTNGTIRFENAVFNSTHGRICKLPGCLCRNFCRSTNKVSTNCSKFNGTAGCIVVVIRRNSCTNELTGCRSSGDYKDTVGGRSFCTVGRHAVNFKFFTGALGKECGRTAAVAVYCNNATERKHEFSHLIVGKTCRIGGLTSVVHYHYKSTVFFDTNERTGCTVCCVVIFAILVFTVFYKETKVCRNNLFFPTGNFGRSGTDLNFGHIRRSCFTIFFIKVNDYASLCTRSLTQAIHINFTVKNHVTKRFTNEFRMLHIVCGVIPTERKVHCRNNVAVTVSLCISSLLGHDLYAVIAGRRDHTFVAGDYFGVFIAEVNFNNVSNLAMAAGSIVEDDFRFYDTRSKLIVIFCDNFVIAIRALGKIDRSKFIS